MHQSLCCQLEVVNEPSWLTPWEALQLFYEEAERAIHEVAPDLVVFFHDKFRFFDQNWGDEETERRKQRNGETEVNMFLRNPSHSWGQLCAGHAYLPGMGPACGMLFLKR